MAARAYPGTPVRHPSSRRRAAAARSSLARVPRPPLVLLTRGAKARPAQDDVLLASVATPRLRPGSRLVRAAHATLPAGTSSGSYGVLTCVDATHRVRERREADPCRGSASRLFVTDAPPAVAGSPAGP